MRAALTCKRPTAKALLVDTGALRAAQLAGDVLAVNAVLMDAYNTDVRPLLAELREEMGLVWRADYLRTTRWFPRRMGCVMPASDPVRELLARSNRLGSDPRNTNYAGGNASAKGTATDRGRRISQRVVVPAHRGRLRAAGGGRPAAARRTGLSG